ncbi:hypothetical protein BIFLAC_07051 [Bifidobacterium animalis subsp. lactis HN019]|uniref:Uncharacterized protein n=1 Tax=Bifidobacterium animalis subsp. lactis CNCM I-2494 TaxID=1042403 RepID=A0A806FJ98_BIFAN|nr:hypothetical protein Balac_0453 [Bifidobacterium animalis subsp. lactis Bl-04]ACS47400.1 hypothetical protein Balat_0453 [Bifidobacterium animalis subsp. lactis DSM 10140]ADG33023.1 hypothetical protein BalV_0435 [Bifidobacterium animalis subsp. lactis V9]AEK29909.1 hypothetical protein BALAC2494_02002 [Bifidobacterium animalis subsp. lactis CNCM I-2494]AGW84673.1 hypothetical protein BLAC_02290 [Bifidobacterium animalis subsp. lactis ATCC 27673]EDT89542.1 hypothetical protein BIFLAC_07051 
MTKPVERIRLHDGHERGLAQWQSVARIGIFQIQGMLDKICPLRAICEENFII